jgi:hypothetical protein
MSNNTTDHNNHPLLDALLDSWQRNTTIMVGLLRALPATGLAARATADARQWHSC